MICMPANRACRARDDSDVSIEALREAESVLANYLRPSPVLSLDPIRSQGGNRILLKAECLLPGGSFKIRGALRVIAGMQPRQRARGIVAYSTGNHARAVAMAARAFATPATVVMSADAPSAKVAAVQELGANVIMAEATSRARRSLAELLAEQHGLALIPPYDHFGVIAGQGTIALELVKAELPRPACVFVPIGGGGLIAGIAAGLKQLDPAFKVVGVEPEWEDDACRSFHTGRRVTLEGPSASIADAVKVQTLGDLTFPLIRRDVDDVVCVSEDAIVRAMRIARTACRLALEPSGAIALAAALSCSRVEQSGATFIAIASGGRALGGIRSDASVART